MSLLCNGSNLQAFPGKFLSSGTESITLSNFFNGELSFDPFLSSNWSSETAIPAGSALPCIVSLPIKDGGIGARIFKEFTQSTNVLAVRDIVASLSADFTQSASVSLVVPVGGAADFAFDLVAAIEAVLNMSTNLTFSFTDTTNLGAIIPVAATLSFTFTPSQDLTGTAEVECDIQPFTELSPQSLANAVWSAVAADNNEVGSMGEKLNDAGSGSNPWTEVIESGLTAAEVLRIILAVQAGKTNIVDNGGGSATVTFRDVADTKNRVEADMQDSERIDVTLDGG